MPSPAARTLLRFLSPGLALLVPTGFRLLGLANPFLTPWNAPTLLGASLDITLPPQAIRRKLPHGRPAGWPGRFLFADDWDRRASEEPIMRACDYMADLMACSDDLTRSLVFREMMERVAAGRPLVKAGVVIGDAAQALRHCEDYLCTGLSLRAQGYRAEMAPDAIEVAVARDGEILHLRQGNHRLALAQVLGLPSVCVRVRFMHRDFAAARLAGAGGRPLAAIGAGLRQLSRAAVR
ncbi:MAG: hypothetical protein KIT20_12685 [Alphaproteobacteria bacterium]|nr:hypothetical protein [Alphaproteobacteria bacterium]